MRTLNEALNQRVLLTDGSSARLLRGHDFDVERDFYGAADCLEILNLTRAAAVRAAHEAFLRAGADIVRTNSLNASPLSLARLGMADHAFYVNFAAAQIACEAVDSVPGRGRRRFVLGVVRDHGWDLTPVEVERAVTLQVEGLLSGGVDGIALDLMPGIGRAPMFLRGAARAKQRLSSQAPVFLQRGHGGTEFSAHALTQADGVIRYRNGKVDRGEWLARAIDSDQVNLIGSGGSPDETQQLDRLLRLQAEDNLRPATAWARHLAPDEVVPPSSSLYVPPQAAEVH